MTKGREVIFSCGCLVASGDGTPVKCPDHRGAVPIFTQDSEGNPVDPKMEHETTQVPRHQLRDDLEQGDDVSANGFLFETLFVGQDYVELNPLENLIENQKMNERLV